MKQITVSIFFLTVFFAGCSADQSDIIVLESRENQTYSEMIKELGPPANKTAYTIKNAPTKSWNHHELFSRYPQNRQNQDIQIMEVTWNAGDYFIFACYHMVDGQNRCLVAKKIRKDIRF